MNRPFWSLRSDSAEDSCDSIASLLSAYADGMASPAEARRIETHLPECKGCRAALAWMQATHATLASRPVAVPPADLRSRIALAIAASPPAPVTLRPARVFTRRAAYAAAASVTALGLALSYPLWHTSAGVAVKHPAKPAVLAALPPSVVTPPLTVRPQRTPKAPARPLVASSRVKPAVRHSVPARQIVPAPVAPPEHVAQNPVPTKLPNLPALVIKAPLHHAPMTQKTASRSIAPAETHGIEKRSPLPAAKTVTSHLTEGPKVANAIKEPGHVPVEIQPTKVIPDPVRQAASVRGAVSLRSNNYLGEVVAHIESMRKVAPGPISVPAQRSYHDATNVMQEVGDTDQTAFISAVHGNQ